MTAEHEHQWGPVEHAHMTGNPHRKCQVEGCGFVSLDLHDDELTHWTVTYAARNANGVAWIGKVTVYACEDTVEEAAREEIHGKTGPPVTDIILVEFERGVMPNIPTP